MLRQALRLALLGSALLAVWSSASACPPIFFRPYYPPMMAAPYYAPQPYYVMPAPQAYPPPRVQIERTKPADFAKPEPAKPDAAVKPAGFKSTESVPLSPPRPEPAVPKAAVPEFKLDPLPGATPKSDVPQLPAPGATTPKDSEGTTIPPLLPPLKGVPDPTVPPLAIPTPAIPKSSTSKASPLSDRPRAEVIPVDGALSDPAGRRTVGFFNRSDRDVRLTVEGQTITLPTRHYVTARVPTTFGWKLDDGPDEKTVVPTAAPGVEVVIRR